MNWKNAFKFQWLSINLWMEVKVFTMTWKSWVHLATVPALTLSLNMSPTPLPHLFQLSWPLCSSSGKPGLLLLQGFVRAHPSAWNAFPPRWGFFLASKSSQWSLLCLILCFRCLLLHNKPPYKFTLLSQWLKQQLFVKTVLQVKWRLLHRLSPFPESDCIQLKALLVCLGSLLHSLLPLDGSLFRALHVTLSRAERSLLPSRSTPRGQALRWPAYQASVCITLANVPLVRAHPWPSLESMWKEITLGVTIWRYPSSEAANLSTPFCPLNPSDSHPSHSPSPKTPSKSHPRRTSSLALRSGSYHLDGVQVWLRCVGTIP